ncbi:hypothetical protein HHK36_031185 [Tetracentron sinense]|uniref:RING-type domain-containing protein n=1 Tax=Tetracentron sinense TaxID=13715 RepID=A0A835CZF2_TETSI|nr:hypothetical protein HHK36_031185 [Tetracentron sinense]
MALQARLHSENLGFPLCGSQEFMDSGSLFYEACFNLQQQQQMQQLQNQQQRNQILDFNVSQVVSPSTSDNLLPMKFSQSLAAQVEKQRQEIDTFIGLQNDRLRLVLQEQRKQQIAILLSRLESRTLSLLKQKDEERTKAAKKTMELEDCLRRAQMEFETWQRISRENEAMVIALNKTLEQVREDVCCFSSGAAEDAESCCDFSHALNRQDRDEEEQTKKMVCKGCNSQSSCILFLPCRHLCSCKSCEAFLDLCPVCNSAKKATIEVFMS